VFHSHFVSLFYCIFGLNDAELLNATMNERNADYLRQRFALRLRPYFIFGFIFSCFLFPCFVSLFSLVLPLILFYVVFGLDDAELMNATMTDRNTHTHK
jgi:hypothetical protein